MMWYEQKPESKANKRDAQRNYDRQRVAYDLHRDASFPEYLSTISPLDIAAVESFEKSLQQQHAVKSLRGGADQICGADS